MTTKCYCGNKIVGKTIKNSELDSTHLLKLEKEVRRKGNST